MIETEFAHKIDTEPGEINPGDLGSFGARPTASRSGMSTRLVELLGGSSTTPDRV